MERTIKIIKTEESEMSLADAVLGTEMFVSVVDIELEVSEKTEESCTLTFSGDAVTVLCAVEATKGTAANFKIETEEESI